MRIDKIATGRNAPDDVNVIVEVPVGGEPIKYELDKESGTLVVDRFLYTAMRYPGNYGFIPHTLSGDGDPVDVLIANSRAIAPGAVISVRPVGVLLMEDNAGMDEKIVAVPSQHISQRFDNIANYQRPAGDHGRARSSISSPTIRIWSPANGSRSCAGAMPTRRASSSSKALIAQRLKRPKHCQVRFALNSASVRLQARSAASLL